MYLRHHASNQVVGENYVAPRHHYGVFVALEAGAGCGLLDRLIADDYRRAELTILVLDRKMGALPQVQRL